MMRRSSAGMVIKVAILLVLMDGDVAVVEDAMVQPCCAAEGCDKMASR